MPENKQQLKLNNEQQFNLLTEYFKSLRDEIHLRIKEHTQLVWIKIITLGFIIYYSSIERDKLFKGNLCYFIWLIPLAAIIFDMLIAGNLRDINNLGHYIKQYIENSDFTKFKENVNIYKPDEPVRNNTFSDRIMHPISLLLDRWSDKKSQTFKGSKDKLKFWEESVAQGKLKYHCYTVEDTLGIWLFTLGSFLFSCLFCCNLGWNWRHIVICVISGIGTFVYAFGYLIRSITMKRQF